MKRLVIGVAAPLFAAALVSAQPLPPLVDLAADRELADHVGFPERYEVTIGEYGAELAVYAVVIESVLHRSLDPGELNQIAVAQELYVPNRYGHEVILGTDALPALLEHLSADAYTAELEQVVTGTVPLPLLRHAAQSRETYVVLAYFDRTAYLVTDVDFAGDPLNVALFNPLAEAEASHLPAPVIDRWEVFRIREES